MSLLDVAVEVQRLLADAPGDLQEWRVHPAEPVPGRFQILLQNKRDGTVIAVDVRRCAR